MVQHIENHKRLEELIDGRLKPVCEVPPLLLSSQSPWAGFLLERDVCREGSARTIFYPHTTLILVTAGSIAVEDRALRLNRRFVARQGSVTLWPAATESRAISWAPDRIGSPTNEMIRVQLNLSILERLAPDAVRLVSQQLEQQPGTNDPALTAIVQLMEAEVAAACPAGQLFGESLCLALALHVAHKYASGPFKMSGRVGGLSQRQFTRVRDYIHDRLDCDLSLSELAGVAGLSPQYFAGAFRRSADVTPHQYVLRLRIEKAKTLLVASRMSLAELAVALGFASQSHFTDVFRKMVGTTPSRFRQMH
jgi:AraC family transcriptional regulator